MSGRRGARWRVVLAVVAAVALAGAALQRLAAPGRQASAPSARTATQPAAAAGAARSREIAGHFQRGVMLLHARRYDYAAVAFHQVLRLAPRLPEAHVNMGFALLGQGRPGAARDFFITAVELNPAQANAYYGIATASEALGDMPAALGAMRTFVHLERADDPHVRRARAALWEWQSPAP